eukprot:299962_1
MHFLECAVILICLCCSGQRLDYYVSINGSDTAECGRYINSSCGTLYHISTIIYTSNSNIHINGQNEREISRHITQNDTYQYHPCMFYGTNVHFYFDSNANWYPNACHEMKNAKNAYIIEIIPSGSIYIHDLIINGHIFNGSNPYLNYGIFNGDSPIYFRNCTFSNIIISDIPYSIQSIYDIHFDECLFQNIMSMRTESFITTDYIIEITNSRIDYIEMDKFFMIAPYGIRISNGYFNQIYTTYSLALILRPEGLYSSTANMVNSQLLNVNNGSIVQVIGGRDSGMSIENVTISTNQQDSLLRDALFVVEDAISRSTFESVQVTYNYHLNKSCNVSSITVYNNYINIAVECMNQIQWINSKGNRELNIINTTVSTRYLDDNDNEITFDDYRLSIAKIYNYSYNDLEAQNVIISFYYADIIEFESLILSDGDEYVFISDINVIGYSTGQAFIEITNVIGNIVDIKNIQYIRNNSNNRTIYNPNDLYSQFILMIVNVDFIYITDSQFGYSLYAVFVWTSDYIHLDNCTFHHSFAAVTAVALAIEMYRCSLTQLGEFYTNIHNIIERGILEPFTFPLTLFVNTITFENNYCGYYSPSGIIRFSMYDVIDVTLRNNVFLIYINNDTIWYRNKTFIEMSEKNLDGLIVFDIQLSDVSDVQVKIIENYFGNNYLNLSAAMILFEKNSCEKELCHACIAGNVFYNFAIYLNSWSISSCIRPKLYQTLYQSQYVECSAIRYQIIDESDLLYLYDTFIIEKHITVFKLNSSNLALQNAYFNVSPHLRTSNIFSLFSMTDNNNLILIDSMVDQNVDIMYDIMTCKIICNQIYNHSSDDERTQITQTSVLCDNKTQKQNAASSGFVIHSNQTMFVNHLSPVFVQLLGSMEYFAGGILRFTFGIFDRLNNSVSYMSFGSEIKLILRNNTISLTETVTINKEWGCDLCEQGIYIGKIEMNDINKQYLVSITEENNQFITEKIVIKVIDCPTGFGITGLESKQCQICPDGYFDVSSVSDNNVCSSCEEAINIGVNCKRGNEITISQNYWMGMIEKDKNESKIISGNCQFGYCCSLVEGCDYFYNQSSLCAENRDYESLLCSECMDGYSALYFSSACGLCEGDYYSWLLYPFLLSIFTVYCCLLLKSNDKKKQFKLLGSNDNPSTFGLRKKILHRLKHYLKQLQIWL